MKILLRLHDQHDLPWTTWFFRQHGYELGNFEPVSYIAKLVLEELPQFRQLSRVQIGDGGMTSFWHDKWLFHNSLAETFPALYSHNTNPELMVAEALSGPLSAHLRARLSTCAREELEHA